MNSFKQTLHSLKHVFSKMAYTSRTPIKAENVFLC